MTFQAATPGTPYGSRGRAVRGSAIDSTLSILARLDRPIISFAVGSPTADAMPHEEIAAAAASVLTEANGVAALGYTPTEGHPVLRAALIGHLARGGTEVAPGSLIVTAGGMQGIDLVSRLFLDPGDLVIAESPSYSNGLATLHNHGATVVQVPLDDEGMDLVAAESAIAEAGRLPRLIYAIPTFQNPSGVSYSLERRQGLLDLARATGALIIEDDPYSELRYEPARPPSLLALDGGRGDVIAVHTFSKIVAPGLRVGWVVAPEDTIRRMVAARQSMDTCANALGQQIIARLIEDGSLDAHIDRLRSLYPRRRDAMMDSLEEHVAPIGGAAWSKPAGGMFIWLRLPPGVDGDVVFERGLERGIAVVPGSAFDPVRCQTAVRLCFTGEDEATIAEGVARLSETIRLVASGAVPARA